MLRQMSFRGILALGLLVAAMGAERVAYYTARVFLTLELARSEGLATAAIGKVVAATSFGTVIAMFVGAGLAFAIGPRLTALVGALVAMLGSLLLLLGAPFLLGWALASAGAGLFRVCPFVVAAELLGSDDARIDAPGQALPPARFLRMTAFAAVAYVAINVSAGLAVPVAKMSYERGGLALASGAAAAAAFVAALFSGGAALSAQRNRPDRRLGPPAADPYRAPAAPLSQRPGAPASMKPLAGAMLLACLFAAFHVGEALGLPHLPELAHVNLTLLYTMSHATSIVLCLIAAGVFLVLALLESARGPLPVFGAALALCGLGFFVRTLAGEQLASHVAAAGLTSFGDVAAPIGTAYAALAVRGRASGFVLAGWFTVATVASMIGSPLGQTPLRTPLLVLVALVCLAAGVAVTALGRTLHRTWFDPAP